MIELFLENSRVDINEIFSTTLTLAIDDVKDFGAKNTTFSKTIVLPGTANNNKLFNQIFDVNARNDYNNTLPNKGTNFNASVSANCIVFDNNIQVVKGVFRLLEIIVDKGMIEYECSIVGELGGFIMKVGNNKLEDLDFSAYNHTYSIANITGSWTNINNGTGYVYPLIDYGTYSANKHDFRVGTFRPALFAREYITKIFAASGYTFQCDLFNTNRFKNLVVPNNQKVLSKISSQALFVTKTNSQTFSYDRFNLPTLYPLFDFNNLVSLGNFTGSPTFVNTGVDINVKAEFQIACSYTRDVNFPISFNIEVLDASNTITQTISLGQVVGYGSNTGTITYNTTSSIFTIPQNHKIRIIAVYLWDNVIGTIFYSFTFNNTNSYLKLLSDGKLSTPININESFEINDILPKNILQKDFISSIIKLFNLYIFEDKDKPKTLLIKPFVDFYADAEIEDWSYKIDRSQPIRIKPMSELNSRYYEFNYKEDSDYYNDLYKKRYNKTYGSLKYDSGFEFSKEVTTVDLIFSGTPLTGVQGEDKVVSAIMKRTGDVVGANEDRTDSNIRLLQIKRIQGVSAWDIHNPTNSSNLWTGDEYLYAGHFDDPDAPSNDLNFGVPEELFFQLATGSINVNQFNVYWSSYMAEITDKDSKLLTVKARLTPIDINNLDFSKLKYIDGSLFRLNKIEDWNASKEDVCNVELLKVINKIY